MWVNVVDGFTLGLGVITFFLILGLPYSHWV